MFRNLSLLSVVFTLLVSCGGKETTQNYIYEPPYVAITDSIEDDPANASLYLRRGLLFEQNEKYNYALADFRMAWEMKKDETNAIYLANILDKKHPDSAFQFLQQAITRVPFSRKVALKLAEAYHERNMPEDALQLLNQMTAGEDSERDAEIEKLKAKIASEKADAESLVVLENAHRLVPNDPRIAYDLAFAYAENNDPKVLKLVDSLINAKAPEIEKAYYLKGLYFANTKQVNEALKFYDLATIANYNFIDAYRDKGQLLYDQKKYDLAIQTYQRAIRVAPAEAEFYHWMGVAYRDKGDIEKAKESFVSALNLNPNLLEAGEALAELKSQK